MSLKHRNLMQNALKAARKMAEKGKKKVAGSKGSLLNVSDIHGVSAKAKKRGYGLPAKEKAKLKNRSDALKKYSR